MSDGTTKWLCVDSSFIAYQARFTMGKLSHEDQAIGIIFGFLTRVLALAETFGSNHFLFCFDSDSSKGVRRRDWPDYKRKRQTDRTKEELADIISMNKQLDLLRTKILPAMGFNNIYRQEGFESDDIIGHLASYPLARAGEISHLYIVSNDGDLAQLLIPRISMYDPSHKKETTHVTFEKEKGYPVQLIPSLKALAGCDSDNLAGIPGVGEKTALKILSKDCPPELLAKAKKHKKENQLRLKLVKLPHEEFDGSQIEVRRPGFTEAHEKAFKGVCKQYALQSYLCEPLASRWNRLFAGVFEDARPARVIAPLGSISLGKDRKTSPVATRKTEVEMDGLFF